jgi:cyclic pyranopterin phosphate synthase
MTEELSHIDDRGQARMVDVGGKAVTHRTARAEATVRMPAQVVAALREGRTPKGDVYSAARLAGIMAAKRTQELIPLCHSLPLEQVSVDFAPLEDGINILATASTHASTGVEMEAMTAVTVAALTLYDMLKALSHAIVIERVRLLEKSGGKSGSYHAGDSTE